LQTQKKRVLSKIEIVIIVLALAADGFTTSWFTGALHKKLSVKPGAGLPVFFSAGRTVFMALGIGAGLLAASFMPDHSYRFGMALLLVVGVKYGIDALKFNPEERIFLIDDNKTMLLLTLAGSISTFFAGIGLGMAGSGFWLTVATAALSVFVFSLAGVWAGEKYGYKPKVRFAGLIPGIVILIIWLRLLIFNLL
jgi:putative Mn2+ efflux pump MntP